MAEKLYVLIVIDTINGAYISMTYDAELGKKHTNMAN